MVYQGFDIERLGKTLLVLGLVLAHRFFTEALPCEADCYTAESCDDSMHRSISIGIEEFQRHRTDAYKGMVARRGMTLSVSLTFSSLCNAAHDKVSFVLRNAQFQIPEDNHVCNRKSCTIIFDIPSSAAIGQYYIYINTQPHRQGIASVRVGPIAIIFNPWSKEDSVHMDDAREINEYVVSDRAGIGKSTDPEAYIYTFDQYDPLTLQLAFELLSNSKTADPAEVARTLVKGVNSILVGKWHGSFADGVDPTDWDGAGQLIHKYFSTGRKPVKFVQCWLYALVLTALGRAVGIPGRVVTGTDIAVPVRRRPFLEVVRVVKLPKNLSEEAQLWDRHSDTVWTWHVWSEFFMMRKDLNRTLGGWQLLDATPQYKSRKYLGPAERALVRAINKAITKGTLTDPDSCSYDFRGTKYCSLYPNPVRGLFLYNDFDADLFVSAFSSSRAHFVFSEHSRRFLLGAFDDAKHAPYGSRFVSQQANGKRGALMDLSCFYKDPCHKPPLQVHSSAASPNYLFELKPPPMVIAAGHPIVLYLHITPLVQSPRPFRVNVIGSVAHRWHSVEKKKISSVWRDVPMTRHRNVVKFEIKPEAYLPKLADAREHAISITLTAIPVPEGSKKVALGDTYVISEPPVVVNIYAPRLQISKLHPKLSGKGSRNACITWTNPSNVLLKDCKLDIKQFGTKTHKQRASVADIEPQEKVIQTIRLAKDAHSLVQAHLRCKNFVAVVGSSEMDQNAFHVAMENTMQDRFPEDMPPSIAGAVPLSTFGSEDADKHHLKKRWHHHKESEPTGLSFGNSTSTPFGALWAKPNDKALFEKYLASVLETDPHAVVAPNTANEEGDKDVRGIQKAESEALFIPDYYGGVL